MSGIKGKAGHPSPSAANKTTAKHPTAEHNHPNRLMTLSEKGIKWLVKSEGCVTKAEKGVILHVLYDDTQKFATIGYGHLVSRKSIAESGSDPKQKPYIHGITQSEAEKLLAQDLKFHVDGIRKNTTHALNQSQFDALVSLSFNAGRSALIKSSIIKHINKGELDHAADAIRTFRVGGGNGPRRKRESFNFTNGGYK
nr:lysozyme [uncultured Holophaga sp.]